jgi:hypothetical protein
MLEPDIDSGDLELIFAKWAEFTGKFYNPALPYNPRYPPPVFECTWTRDSAGNLKCDYVIDKEDCRQLLWAIDTDIECIGARRSIFVKKESVCECLYLSDSFL